MLRSAKIKNIMMKTSIQDITDEIIRKIDDILSLKEKEILEN